MNLMSFSNENNNISKGQDNGSSRLLWPVMSEEMETLPVKKQ